LDAENTFGLFGVSSSIFFVLTYGLLCPATTWLARGPRILSNPFALPDMGGHGWSDDGVWRRGEAQGVDAMSIPTADKKIK